MMTSLSCSTGYHGEPNGGLDLTRTPPTTRTVRSSVTGITCGLPIMISTCTHRNALVKT